MRDDGEDALLEIQDSGIGMDPEKLPERFKAFKQESEGLDWDYEGTGLALSIVQRRMEALGGDMEVEPERNQGTCFSVQLPRSGPSP